MPDIESLVTDPNWLPHRFDFKARTIRFVHLSRDEHRAVTFLDDEYLDPMKLPTETMSMALLEQSRPAGTTSLQFVFHSAFCCSTLLARALDIPGVCFALKEPKIINDLAVAKLASSLRGDDLDLILHLLARPFGAGESVVIKPSNEANVLIGPLLAARPASRALLLSSALEDFLLSVTKKGLWGRAWARRLFMRMHPHERRETGFSAREIFEQTDLQIAALVWLMHRSQFIDLLAASPDKFRTLSAADLLADKAGTLSRTAVHFGFDLQSEHARALASGAAFAEHSKERRRAFNNADRANEMAALEAVHGDEIAMVVNWTEAVAMHIGVPMTLPLPLGTD